MSDLGKKNLSVDCLWEDRHSGKKAFLELQCMANTVLAPCQESRNLEWDPEVKGLGDERGDCSVCSVLLDS